MRWQNYKNYPVVVAGTPDRSNGIFEMAGKELTDARAKEIAVDRTFLNTEPPFMRRFTDFKQDASRQVTCVKGICALSISNI